jgi:hypothetical protein
MYVMLPDFRKNVLNPCPFVLVMGNMKINMSFEDWWNDTDSGKQKYSEINASQCHFVPANVTWKRLVSSLGFRGKRTATNSLFHT